ncbi:MAG: VOC family protein [Bacteriovorax sp.]|nr:VOC family protein [Bacteriovorax sp.]
MSKIQLSHVALLVPSVRKAADYLRKFDFQIGKEEEFEGEGTREIYVEGHKPNSLLLMEPLAKGPYHRALHKRGPGVHHIAIDVLNLELYLESIASSGWLLHPMSIKTIKEAHTAYLARPGFPALIEVHGRK